MLEQELNRYETELFDKYNNEVPDGRYYEPGNEDAGMNEDELLEAEEFISRYGIPFDAELPFN